MGAIQVFYNRWGEGATSPTTSTKYFSPISFWRNGSNNIATGNHPWIIKGVFRNLRVEIGTPAVSPASFEFTLFVNSSATALQVVAGPGSTGGTSLASVSVNEGDLIALRWRRTGGGSGGPGTQTYVTIEFEANDAEYPTDADYLSGYGTNAVTFIGTATADWGFFRMADVPTATSTTGLFHRSNIVCAAGEVRSYKVQATGGTGYSGAAQHVFTIYKNGVAQDGSGGTPDTRLTLNAANPTSATWTGTLSLALADNVGIRVVGSGFAAGTGNHLACGIRYRATRLGDWNISGAEDIRQTDVLDGTPTYFDVSNISPDPIDSKTETNRSSYGHIAVVTIDGFIAQRRLTLPAGKTWTMTGRKNGADVCGPLAFSGATLELSDLTSLFTVGGADRWSMQGVASGMNTTDDGSLRWTFRARGLTEGSPIPEVSPASPGSPEPVVGTIGPLAWLEWPRRIP